MALKTSRWVSSNFQPIILHRFFSENVPKICVNVDKRTSKHRYGKVQGGKQKLEKYNQILMTAEHMQLASRLISRRQTPMGHPLMSVDETDRPIQEQKRYSHHGFSQAHRLRAMIGGDVHNRGWDCMASRSLPVPGLLGCITLPRSAKEPSGVSRESYLRQRVPQWKSRVPWKKRRARVISSVNKSVWEKYEWKIK